LHHPVCVLALRVPLPAGRRLERRAKTGSARGRGIPESDNRHGPLSHRAAIEFRVNMLAPAAPNKLKPGSRPFRTGGGKVLERLMQRALNADRAATIHPNPARSLFWGLFCFSVLMLFVAWAGIGELVIPPTSGPGVRLIDMPAPLLALNAALCILPIAAFLLILAGVSGMMRFIPAVGRRLVWRVGKYYVTAVRLAAYIVVAYVLVIPVLIVVTFLAFSGTPPSAAMGLAAGLVVGAVPIALGWYLMFLAGWSLSAVSRRMERRAVILAVIWAGAFAALLIAAQVFATIVMGSAALNSNAGIPPRVPWADAASGVAGFAALIVLTLVARRVTRRADQPGTAPMAETA